MKGFGDGPGTGLYYANVFRYHFALCKNALFPPHVEGFGSFLLLGIMNANSVG